MFSRCRIDGLFRFSEMVSLVTGISGLTVEMLSHLESRYKRELNAMINRVGRVS